MQNQSQTGLYDVSIQKEVNRLQQEIQQSDKKLFEGLIKASPNQKELLQQIYHEMYSNNQNNSNISKTQMKNEDHEENRVSKSPRIHAFTPRDKVLDNLAAIQHKSYGRIDEVKYIIKKIFHFYVSFGDRLNSSHLKANKLYKMMHDAFILDQNLNKKRLDLLFCRFGKGRPSIEFQDFLSLLIEISTIKFPNLSDRESFLEVFHSHLKPLYNNLYKETDLGELDVLFKEPLDKETIETIESINDVLKKLHKVYFPDEYQRSGIKQCQIKCESSILSFLKDFDICPSLISCGVGLSLMNEIIDSSIPEIIANNQVYFKNTQDFGQFFTQKKFSLFIAKLGILCYQKIFILSGSNKDQEECSNNQKLLQLLEKIELSKGFVKLERVNSSTSNLRFSLIPFKYKENAQSTRSHHEESYNAMTERPKSSRAFLSPLQSTNRQNLRSSSSKKDYYANQITSARSRTPQYNAVSGGSGLNQSSIDGQQKVSEFKDQSILFDKYADLMQQIFKAYSTISGGASKYEMKSIKLIKLFKSAGLIKEFDAGASDMQPSAKRLQQLVGNLINDNKIKNFIQKSKREIDIRALDLYLAKIMKHQDINATSSQYANTNRSFEGSPFKFDTKLSDYGLYHGARLDYNQFLSTIAFVSQQIYPELDEEVGIQFLIEKYLHPVFQKEFQKMGSKSNTTDSKVHLQKLMQLLKDETVVDILGRLKKTLHPFFVYYAGGEYQMDFNKYSKFCKDFDIFPQILSRAKLMALFHNLSNLQPLLQKPNSMMNNSREEEQNKMATIDENLFVESLALCASEIEDNISAHIIDKISYLLEKMGEANTPKQITKSMRISLGQVKRINHLGQFKYILSGMRLYFDKHKSMEEQKQKEKLIGQQFFSQVYSLTPKYFKL